MPLFEKIIREKRKNGMKRFAKLSCVLTLIGCVAFSSSATENSATAASYFTTTSTGYTCAEDVEYKYSGDYLANWGARGEDCTFLSTYAKSFYTGSYVYETLSSASGGSTQDNAHQSQLYRSLQTLMTSKHTHKTSYGETRNQYRYTDCVSSNTNKISSFYSGTVLGGSWGSSPTWNREHTWPKSKGLGGQDIEDIMMLRPTAESENSSRGNTAYGEGGGYYDPNCEGSNVRGDCARIVLYTYVRWGNTSYMWGTSGVMQSMDVLLRWMQEDPVDTWEMGRNDAVEQITGTRNVFVDYPEYAWLLFGKAVPANMSTPSKKASNGTAGGNSSNATNSSGSSSSSSEGSTQKPVGNTEITIQQALTLAEQQTDKTFTSEKYYVTGRITEISEPKYGDLYIEDEEGNSIYVYGLYSANGAVGYGDMTDPPVVGDTIKVLSVVGKYNGTKELKNAWLVEIIDDEQSSSEEYSSVEESSEAESAVDSSSETESGVESVESGNSLDESAVDSNSQTESESAENSQLGGLMGASCVASVYLTSSGVFVGLVSAFIWKKRKYK